MRGLEYLDVPEIIKQVKTHYQEKLVALEKINPRLADDTTLDNNKMESVIIISMALRTFKLILLIFNFSFYIGMSWLILCINYYTFLHNKTYPEIMRQDYI